MCECKYCGYDNDGDAILADIASKEIPFGKEVLSMSVYVNPNEKKISFWSSLRYGGELCLFEGDINYCPVCGRKL